jgi:hypothetical protein
VWLVRLPAQCRRMVFLPIANILVLPRSVRVKVSLAPARSAVAVPSR